MDGFEKQGKTGPFGESSRLSRLLASVLAGTLIGVKTNGG